MSKKKSIFHINTKLYYILLILQLFFYFIKCEGDCNDCSLDINDLVCKKVSGESCECFSNFETKKCYGKVEGVTYYTINNQSVIKSMDKSGCQNKVIHKTKECVGHCPKGTYELGDFCYLINELSNVNTDVIFGTLECQHKYIIEEDLNNKNKKYNCLGSDVSCKSKGYPYYDDKTNQCIKECVNKKRKIETETETNGDIRCSDECKSDEFQYSVIENQKTITYCSQNRTSDKCKYYYVSQNKVNICINECNEGDFVEGNECVTECSSSNKAIMVDLSSTDKKIECKSEGEVNSDLYKYETNYHFQNCEDTLLFTKLKRITYKFENGEKKCVDDCSTTSKKFIAYGKYECTDCSGKYYYGNICYEDACPPEQYYLFLIETTDIGGTSPKQCVDKCPAGYYESKNKTCFPLSESNVGQNCPTDHFINSTFQCNTCKKPVNSSSIKEGEGYYVKDERICYSSCPTSALYHDIDNNECSNIVCKERESYKYSAYDNPYICYKSCDSISEEYKYEKDYICYKTQTTCDSYYYIENSVTQCASYDNCKEKEFKYIQEKQCVKNCSENYFRIDESYDTNGKIQNLGECFPDERGCINLEYFYYNKTDKICLKECDAYKLSQTEKLKNDLGETCFSSHVKIMINLILKENLNA